MLFMAWPPARRSKAGRFEVEHPGDYATINSNHLRDGTGGRGALLSPRKAQSRFGFLRQAIVLISAMVEGELDATLLRPRYGRLPKNSGGGAPTVVGHRPRSLMGTFGKVEIARRALVSKARTARRSSGRARFCVATSAARWRPMR
jgi:hypothetical protein